MFVERRTKKRTKKSVPMRVAETTVDKSGQIRSVIETVADMLLPSDAEKFRSRVEDLLKYFMGGSICKRVASLYFDEEPSVKKRRVIPELDATYTLYDRIDMIDCDGERYYVHAEEEAYRFPEHEIIHSYRVKVVEKAA
jgi:hypothetical protein